MRDEGIELVAKPKGPSEFSITTKPYIKVSNVESFQNYYY